MVAQVPDNVVITTVGVVRVCRCTLHRRNTRWRFARLVILLTLLLYLHHASGIVFLTCRNVFAADAIDIAELAYTEFTCYTFIADEVMLGKAVLDKLHIYHSIFFPIGLFHQLLELIDSLIGLLVSRQAQLDIPLRGITLLVCSDSGTFSVYGNTTENSGIAVCLHFLPVDIE